MAKDFISYNFINYYNTIIITINYNLVMARLKDINN